MHDDALGQLFPGLTDEELQRAQDNLDRYLEIAWAIMEELESATDVP